MEFARVDGANTAVTFHSAHRLNAPGGIHIANVLLLPALERTFLDHTRRYRDRVE